MIARKRWSIGTGCLAAAMLWATGCESMNLQTGGAKPAQDPFSQLPADEGPLTEDGISAEILPETHVAAGRLHESQGRLERAAEQYQLALEASPADLTALNRLGIVLDRLGRFRQADETFAKAIAVAPNEAHLHNNLAFSHIMQNRWRDAERELNKALEIHPGFTRARVNLGMVLAQQARYDEALAQCEQAVARADAWYNMGLMYQSKERPLEAAMAFKTALALNPELIAARKRLAVLPTDIVGQAEANIEALASPPAAVASADKPADQTDRPQSDTAVSEPGERTERVDETIAAQVDDAEPAVADQQEPTDAAGGRGGTPPATDTPIVVEEPVSTDADPDAPGAAEGSESPDPVDGTEPPCDEPADDETDGVDNVDSPAHETDDTADETPDSESSAGPVEDAASNDKYSPCIEHAAVDDELAPSPPLPLTDTAAEVVKTDEQPAEQTAEGTHTADAPADPKAVIQAHIQTARRMLDLLYSLSMPMQRLFGPPVEQEPVETHMTSPLPPFTEAPEPVDKSVDWEPAPEPSPLP